jgi:hypothetical protein
MKRKTIVEPLPWNDHKGLILESNVRLEVECCLIIDHDGQETQIELDQTDIRNLIQELQGILEGKEVSNG